jgi:cell division protein FtsB
MRNWFFNPLSLIALTAVTLFTLFSLRSTASKTQTSTEDVRLLDQEVAQLTSEVSSLEKQVELNQHPFYAEKNIRNELLLQKPGEYVIQIPEVSPQPLPTVLPEATPTPWQEWRQLLF